jgi:DNA-binding response OmpR family regulator
MQNMAHKRIILLVEGFRIDESSLAYSLQKANFEVMVVQTGRQALEWAQMHAPDLVVFDASSMRSSGARTCRRLRGMLGSVPIIHCRVEGHAEDPSILADVYLEQPFTGRKLLNRVRDLLPVDLYKEEIIRFGHILLYRSKRAVVVEEKGEQRLTPKLAQLLEEFLRHPNELVSRRQLMRNVWHTDYVGDTRTLDVHVRWVRECIENDPSNPALLRTVRGKGFILALPDPKS